MKVGKAKYIIKQLVKARKALTNVRMATYDRPTVESGLVRRKVDKISSDIFELINKTEKKMEYLPAASSGTPMPPCKPPRPCPHTVLINGICNWCKTEVKK